MAIGTKVSSTWKNVTSVAVKVAGVWKTGVKAFVKVAGVWKEVTPASGIPIPAGAIVPMLTSSVPAGFTRFTAADNKYIVGAGSSYGVNTTGGSASVTLSGTTNSTGGHSGGTTIKNQRAGNYTLRSGNSTAGAHTHTFSKGITAQDVYKDYMFVKADAEEASIPVNGVTLSASTLTGDLSNVESSVDSFMRSSASFGGTGGAASFSNESVTSSSNGSHIHGPYSAPTSSDHSNGSYNSPEYSGNHSHTIYQAATLDTKRKYLAAWSNTSSDYSAEEGSILLWDGAVAPDGWQFCDGTNGTPDMQDYFARIGTTSNMGQASGDNSCAVSVTSSSNGSHSHPTTSYGADQHASGENAYHSNSFNAHTHSSSYDKTIVPPYYALHFIMAMPQ